MATEEPPTCRCDHDRAPRWHESLFSGLFSEEGFMVVVFGGLALAAVIGAVRS